jgi:lipoprotein-anchoring transpeptidase ErfK/SrfK
MPEKKKSSKKKEFTKNQKIALYCIGALAIFILSILITNIVISNITSTKNVNEANAAGNSVVENNTTNEVENNTVNEVNEVNAVNETNTTNTTTNTTTSNGLGTTAEEKEQLLKKYSSSPYYIKVNKTCNVVTVYTKDSNGNYTVPYKAMLCATGPYTPPTNKKAVYKKSVYPMEDYRRRWGTLQGHNGHTYVYGQYVSGIVDNVLFHSSTYLTKEDPGSLEWDEFNKLGTSASAGCVRLCVRDVKWIYDNVPANTLCEFYEDSNPGPLGKPTLPKIPSDSPNRGWDPTDPDPNNPWNKKVETPKQETNTITETNTTTNTNETTNSTNTTN